MTDRMKNKIVRKNLHMKLHETLGIQKELFDRLLGIFETYSNVEKVTVFGSRARGDHRDNSDMDICIFGHELAEI
jgi:predicted nucleotidyltransferase